MFVNGWAMHSVSPSVAPQARPVADRPGGLPLSMFELKFSRVNRITSKGNNVSAEVCDSPTSSTVVSTIDGGTVNEPPPQSFLRGR